MTTPTPSKEEVAQGVSDTPGTADAWFRVEVTDFKGKVVAIESEMLSGRDIGDAEREVICRAIDHLAGFIGQPSSPPPQAHKHESVAVAEALERAVRAQKALEELIDIWDDGQRPYELRCYVEGAWGEALADARAALLPSVDHTRSGSGK